MSCPGSGKHGLDTSGTCEECYELSVELEYAERYAVASIIYYSNAGINTGMSDAQYDGFCDWLLGRQVWKRIPWIERDLLLCGSGFDTKKFPSYIHEWAKTRMTEAML